MKNKKLFAILTLVCFMFTLMPVAAFAADNQVYVNGLDEAEVMTGVEFQATVGTTASGYVFFMVDEDGEGAAVSADGKFSLKTAGEYEVYALAATDAIVDFVEAVGTPASKVATLQASYADAIDTYDCAVVTIEAPDMEYRIRFEDKAGNEITSLDILANGGFNAGDSNNVVAVLEKAVEGTDTYSALKGMELTLTTVGYVDAAFVDGVAKTDKNGEAEFEVVSEIAGDFKVIAKWNKTKATLDVNVDATGAADVVVNAEPTAPVNIDNEVVKAGVEFKFTDANGAASYDANEITLVEKPANSKLKSENFFLASDDENKEGVFDLDADKDFDKEGTYKVRVALENGASATATIKVAEFGDVVAIQFVKAPTSVAYNAVSAPVIGQGVVAVDADGVTDADITGVKYSVSGKAVKAFDATNGKVTMQDEEDYIGQSITVYAVYEVGGETFTTSNTLKVIDSAAGIKYTEKTAEVAVNNKLTARIFDANGNVVTLPTANVKVIVLDQPENAVVVATATYAAKTGITVNLLASQAGDYELQTIVTYNDGAAERYISDIETITVGAGAGTFKDIVVVSLGADKMIVNDEVVALDVAPFIENNRTMMQFNVLYVFGIDVQWVAETQSIVAEGNGLKVVMQLGSKVATVNGAEVALDVAPYSVNGRTVVPVGFITGLLDITPTFTYNADGTIADILFTK